MTSTQFSEAQLARYLYMFDAGKLVRFSPLAGPGENSLYSVTMSEHGEEEDYVLTILETVSFDEISFFHNLISHLSYYGLPVPAPRRTRDGMTSTIFCGRPTLLMPSMDGEQVAEAGADEVRALGTLLGELHDATSSYEHSRSNAHSVEELGASLADANLDEATGTAVRTALDRAAALGELPSGVIHADLTRANVLFDAGEISAVTDFFKACNERLIEDVAIALNDWCTNPDGSLDDARQAALLEGYSREREPSADELAALPTLRALAAARAIMRARRAGSDPAFHARILNAC